MAEINTKDYAIVCREISKDFSEVTTYEVETEIDNSILQVLKLRSRFNQELSYYLILRENLELCLNVLKTSMRSEIEIEDGIMVKL